MRINEVATLYKNVFEEGTAKGSFFITDNGLMTPRTRNVTLWGLASSFSIPERFRSNPKIITSLKGKLEKSPETPLPAFFKFQKSPLSIFTEAVGMEVATHFNTNTSFNYPANINKSHNSLYQSVSPYLDTETDYGNMVFSFLGRDEELITFYKIGRAQELAHDVTTIFELVPQFVKQNLPDLSPSEAQETILQIQQDYAYQYLLRDYLGDIDFTSKNSGIVLNRELGYAHIAPNFDYGEVMNALVHSKFIPPVLDSVDNYTGILREIMTQEKVDAGNAKKLERFNAPISKVARENTFGFNSEVNINVICTKFPEVAESFMQDLQEFVSSGELTKIVEQYTGEDNIVTEEQGKLAVEYLQERSAVFTEKLEDNLSYVSSDLRYRFYSSWQEEIDPEQETDTLGEELTEQGVKAPESQIKTSNEGEIPAEQVASDLLTNIVNRNPITQTAPQTQDANGIIL